MDINQEFNVRTQKFQQAYSYGALLEMYVISIMNFLVDVGFVKQEDLSMMIMKEMDRFEEGIKAQKQAAADRGQGDVGNPMEQFRTTAPKEEKQSFADFIKNEKGDGEDEKTS